MTVHVLSTLPGVTPGDSAPGSTTAALLNAYIAGSVLPGDVIDANCPISPNGTIVVQGKLGVAWRGAGAMGSRISPSGHFDGVHWYSNESCVMSDVGIAPKVVQNAGVGLVVDEYANSRVGLDNKFVRVNVFDRTRQQGRWSLGTGAPYKGIAVRSDGGGGGYKTRFSHCQVNGARSDGWEFGYYGQSTRGPVGVQLIDCESGANLGHGYAVFAAEALALLDNTEALRNRGHGVLTYPDNGGFVELDLIEFLADTNWLHGVNLNAGGAGAGGTIKVVRAINSWFSNNGNPDVAPSGIAWGSASGFVTTAAPQTLKFLGNTFAVNGQHGALVSATQRLLFCNNEALNNGQEKTTGGVGGHGLFGTNLPVVNAFNNNIADGQAYSSYTAQQWSGIGTTGGFAANATGNVSKNPNWGAPAYSWHAAPNAANNQ